MEPSIDAVREYLTGLQERLCEGFQALDPRLEAQRDSWDRPGGGGGIARAFAAGSVLEKAGANFSDVHGEALPAAASAKRPHLTGCGFRAMGVSVVIHPRNPYVPTTHMNVRFFRAEHPETGETHWWFGGGFDLTPYYPFPEDVVEWHRAAHKALEPHAATLYPRFKNWCDEYFYIKHRQETRGVGGLFFDDFNELGFEDCFALTRQVGDAFFPAFRSIAERRKGHEYTERERAFQLYRRGRYVEFNLVYDRGTLFGLQSEGRTESILMSMPPLARWDYNWQPAPGSAEERLYTDYLRPRDWLMELA